MYMQKTKQKNLWGNEELTLFFHNTVNGFGLHAGCFSSCNLYFSESYCSNTNKMLLVDVFAEIKKAFLEKAVICILL